ncbi:MAG: NAD(P)/FAD-dependent oxidoreductase [Lentihominibacter sp.]
MKNTKYHRIVVGAGAAGLFYAAADTSPGRKLLLEKTPRPGQKLLMSGSGMCNITHGGSIKDFPAHYGSSGGRIRGCLYRHSNLELMKFLEEGGIPLEEREDGKIFPVSRRASDILNFLLAKAAANGYDLRCSCPATDINALISMLRGAPDAITGRLIIATGGASYPVTGSDGTFFEIMRKELGIAVTELRPALAPVYVQDYRFSELSGVSFRNARLCLGNHESLGPLLLTHRGFSGPAALHISQYVKPGMTLHISFLPDFTTSSLLQKLRRDQPGNSTGFGNYISRELGLPKAFAAALLRNPSQKFSSVSGGEVKSVAEMLTDMICSVSGTGSWREAMVTAGGVSLKEVDLKNMSLTSYPFIKVIGEALDINGDTGGYNLQFAYSSAMAALSDSI